MTHTANYNSGTQQQRQIVDCIPKLRQNVNKRGRERVKCGGWGSVESTSQLHWRQNAVPKGQQGGVAVHWVRRVRLEVQNWKLGTGNWERGLQQCVNQCNAIIKHISSSSFCAIHMRNALDMAAAPPPPPLPTLLCCNPFFWGGRKEKREEKTLCSSLA